MKNILLITLLSVSGHIEALEETGTELLAECSGRQGMISSAYCEMGISKYRSGELDINREKPANACVPDEVSGDQLKRIVVKYLEENPGKLDQEAFSLMDTAISKAFPCTK